MLPIPGLALALLLGGVVSRSPDIDATAVEKALAIRAGERAGAWSIVIEPVTDAEVRVQLRNTQGLELVRSYALVGTTLEERSRELGATLALVLEQHADVEPEPTTPRPGDGKRAEVEKPPKAPPLGWIAAGGRVALGKPTDLDAGATLRGGLTWGREILQPLVHVASVHARSGSLRLDGVRIGLGLAAGLPLRKWWFGAAVVPQLAWARARDRRAVDGFAWATEVTALIQWRGTRGLHLGARLGTDISAPPFHVTGQADELRLGPVRFVAGLEVGLRLPPGRHR